MSAPLIYLDHNATTPISPKALAAMTRAFQSGWGNAGSIEHAQGRQAADQLAEVREVLAGAIGARADEFLFTSGATEANNLAIVGTARFRAQTEGKTRIVVSAMEHKCVLEAAKNCGLKVDICRLLASGDLDLDHLDSLLDDTVAMVSIMAVNNETGAVQDLDYIRNASAKFGIKFHVDAAQALGKVPIDAQAVGVDLLSFSAHKTYGPMGVGGLYVRRRPRARLLPLFHGGGQERGLRSGTTPVPLCVGFSVAAVEAVAMAPREQSRLAPLQASLEQQVSHLWPEAVIKNQMAKRVANTVNISLPRVSYAQIYDALGGTFAISSGSACSSATIEPSYVLVAMGVDPQVAKSSIRVGLGRQNCADHIDALVMALAELKDRAPWSS